MKRLSLALLLLGAVPACKRAEPPLPVGTPEAPRRIDIKLSNLGYTPDRLTGRPGERLTLVFHYDASAGECGREVLLPEGAEPRHLALATDKPGATTLTMPRSGELQFTCGMNMLRGTLVVQ